jgi:hypothetical protein
VKRVLLLGSCCCLLMSPTLSSGASSGATAAASTGVSASLLLGLLSTAFSGGKVVHQVQLTGSATWHAGSLNDTGTATLSGATTGASQLQLSLSSSGVRTEGQSGQGSDQSCTWSSEDGAVHSIDPASCWRPLFWFLPPLSLQPSLLPNYLGTVDMGTGTVGFAKGIYRHLQSQLVLPNLTTALAGKIMQVSTTDLGLDPASFLPAVLTYSVRPDSGAFTPIAIEIHYSNYQPISGVEIPFTIQRYVNGSLQLEITVSSAQVN